MINTSITIFLLHSPETWVEFNHLSSTKLSLPQYERPLFGPISKLSTLHYFCWPFEIWLFCTDFTESFEILTRLHQHSTSNYPPSMKTNKDKCCREEINGGDTVKKKTKKQLWRQTLDALLGEILKFW